jgi:predicted metal-dependent hydrolase
MFGIFSRKNTNPKNRSKKTASKKSGKSVIRHGLRRRLGSRLRIRRRIRRPASKASQLHYAEYKEATRALVAERIPHFIGVYRELGIEFKPPGKVFIKNTRTRWGSCSSKGNLNFSYRLSLLPSYLSDYIIVHELCHLREFNHSSKFWDLVGKTMPGYDLHRQELKKHSLRHA